ATLINEARVQCNYRSLSVLPNDPNGPELNVTGFGFFNRDIFLPSRTIERRYEFADNLTYVRGTHRLKIGGSALIRGGSFDLQTFFRGGFGFSVLPGAPGGPPPAAAAVNPFPSLGLGFATPLPPAFRD